MRAPAAPEFAPGGTCLDRWSHAVRTPISHGQLERAILGFWGKNSNGILMGISCPALLLEGFASGLAGGLARCGAYEILAFRPKWARKAADRGGGSMSRVIC